MTTARLTVLERFLRAFITTDERYEWVVRSGLNGLDYWGSYVRFQYARWGSIYFPLTVNHAHITTGGVQYFHPRVEDLQQCLDDNGVPIGPECCNAPDGEYVIGPEHADAVIAVLRNG